MNFTIPVPFELGQQLLLAAFCIVQTSDFITMHVRNTFRRQSVCIDLRNHICHCILPINVSLHWMREFARLSFGTTGHTARLRISNALQTDRLTHVIRRQDQMNIPFCLLHSCPRGNFFHFSGALQDLETECVLRRLPWFLLHDCSLKSFDRFFQSKSA